MRILPNYPTLYLTAGSDKIGRKPVILVGITGIAISTLFMGLSNSLFGIIFARSLGMSHAFILGTNLIAVHCQLVCSLETVPSRIQYLGRSQTRQTRLLHFPYMDCVGH